MNYSKVVKKAYQYSPFNWLDVDAKKPGTWQETVWADSPTVAKFEGWQKMKESMPKIRIYEVAIRPNRKYDLIENQPLAIVSELSQEQKEVMKITSGIDKHGVAVQNFFVSDGRKVALEDLVEKGLMAIAKQAEFSATDMIYFLTDFGIQVVQSMQPQPRYIVENQLNNLQDEFSFIK